MHSVASSTTTYGTGPRLRGSAGTSLPNIGTARYEPASSFDMSGSGCLVGMFRLSFDNSATTQAENGLIVGWSDGSSTELFSISGLDLSPEGDPFDYFALSGGITPDLSEGSPNLGSLTQAIFGASRNLASGGTAPNWIFDQVYWVNDLTLLDGEIANPSSFLWLKSEIDNLTPALSSNIGSDRQISLPFPLKNQAAYFNSEGEFLAFQQSDGIKRRYKSGFLRYLIEPSLATDYQRHAFGSLSSPEAFDVEVSSLAHASATIEIESYSFVSGGGTVTYRSPVVVAGGADSGFNTVHYIGGSISNRQVSGVSGRTTQVQIDCTPGQDLGAVGFQLGSNAQLALNPSSAGASAIALTGISATGTLDVVNLTSNAITITIASGQTFTTANNTGGVVTVQQPQIALTALNFADGVRVFAARQQTFRVNSADINTGTNEITLGADDETGATFAGQTTSPATLLLLTLADGATIPTTSPQIESGNLYYVVANTAGVVQISETEGGTAIAFTDAGTESGGQLLQLKAETELINAVVSGGDGLSSPLTLPTGAVLSVAAQHRPSAASASTLFERQVSWGSDGAAITETFSATNNPDTLHNALVGATIQSNSGLAVTVTSDGATVAGLAFDLSGDIQVDANAITDAVISFPDGYLWMVYMRSTEMGIRFIRNQFTAVGLMDFRFNSGLTIDNVADGIRNSPATTLTVYGNVQPTTGSTVVATESGTIHIVPFFVTSIASAGGGSSAPTVEQIWTHSDRTLTGSQATNIAALGTPNTFKADVSGLSTFDPATQTVDVGRVAGNAVTGTGDFQADLSGLTTAVGNIPTNPLLTTDMRLNNLNAPIGDIPTTAPLDAAAIQSAAAAALTAYDPPTRAELTADKAEVLLAINGLPAPSNATLANQQAILTAVGALPQSKEGYSLSAAGVTAVQSGLATPTDVTVTVDGGFTASDRTLITDTNKQVKADEVKTATTYQRKEAGTETVILNKTIDIQGDNVTVTNAP